MSTEAVKQEETNGEKAGKERDRRSVIFLPFIPVSDKPDGHAASIWRLPRGQIPRGSQRCKFDILLLAAFFLTIPLGGKCR